jgi:hypothetical protein
MRPIDLPNDTDLLEAVPETGAVLSRRQWRTPWRHQQRRSAILSMLLFGVTSLKALAVPPNDIACAEGIAVQNASKLIVAIAHERISYLRLFW